MIAVIGKIGVGKSTFLKQLKNYGFKIFIADDFIRDQYRKDGVLYKLLIETIGLNISNQQGINRQKLRAWVNEQPYHLAILEKLIYPVLTTHLKQIHYDLAELPVLNSPYADFAQLFDTILWLDAPSWKRIKNLKSRKVNAWTIKNLDKLNNPVFVVNKFRKSKNIIYLKTTKLRNCATFFKIHQLLKNFL
ncbi:dephospho-CoA kinase [Mycoplasmopsis columbinasalis]|uniref:Dephospho-CoA kinase n=1 Tax=Mycoplasmopsis columbinasalis TaxID=114880 RepID=A0A449BAU6_9BACT|nr:dephospho-CoA kinase [Mycoplasmopsis columbinasalis]VEU78335.1 putative dephospho-CoA kinase [Mycoplasmopsis columbinasalis]